MTGPETGALDAAWNELLTAALLGTDRRSPPIPDVGPVADLVADAVRPDDGARMLATVGAVAAARRAAFVPGAPCAVPQRPAHDERPFCSSEAFATWRSVVAEWPVLEDEWVLTLLELGLRLPPDGVAELMVRHQRDAVRRARVAMASGPVADWLVDHIPSMVRTTAATASADEVTSLPDLPVPPELAELLLVDAHTFTGRVIEGFETSRFGPAHRAVLVNLLARCRPAVLLDAADGLERTRVGLALALSDLARLRHRMLSELGAKF